MTKCRPIALGAAVALGLGSLLIAAPAMAKDSGSAEAPNTQDSTAAQSTAPQKSSKLPAKPDAKALAAIQSADDFEDTTGGETVATGYDANGDQVLLADANEKNAKVDAFAEQSEQGKTQFAQVLFTQPAVAYSATDLPGGAGYLLDAGNGAASACSIGFPAWGADGKQAFFTAGHCASDGAATSIYDMEKPSTAPAVTGDLNGGFDPLGVGAVGALSFYQHGGPGNSEGTDGDKTSTDIAVATIDGTENNKFTIKPGVTDWSSAGSNDLAASTTPIKSVADPVKGDVAKSGRTTGVSTGDTYVEGGCEDNAGNTVDCGETYFDSWMKVDGHYVYGFMSDVDAFHGDSGGAVYQGSKAVGLVSGGPEDRSWLWSTRLKSAIEHTDHGDWEVAVTVGAPKVTSDESGDTVAPGATISGTVDNAKTVDVDSQSNAGETADVSDGKFSFKAPSAEGDYTYSLTGYNSRSHSESTEFKITVEAADPEAPGAPKIKSVDTTKNDFAVTGTGEAGATVDVTVGDQTVSGTVDDDGTWSVKFTDVAIGEYDSSATQTVNGLTSKAAKSTVTVRPVAPAFTSPKAGAKIANDDSPTAITGTGTAGAKVTLDDGADSRAITAKAAKTITVGGNGTWKADLGGALAAGTYHYSAKQTVNGVASKAASLTFTVRAADSTDPGDPGNPGNPGNPDDPGNPGDPDQPGGDLPVTGEAASLLPFGIATGVLLLIGGGVTALVARRQLKLNA